jgi:hypothetical protein
LTAGAERFDLPVGKLRESLHRCENTIKTEGVIPYFLVPFLGKVIPLTGQSPVFPHRLGR